MSLSKKQLYSRGVTFYMYNGICRGNQPVPVIVNHHDKGGLIQLFLTPWQKRLWIWLDILSTSRSVIWRYKCTCQGHLDLGPKTNVFIQQYSLSVFVFRKNTLVEILRFTETVYRNYVLRKRFTETVSGNDRYTETVYVNSSCFVCFSS